MEHQVHQEQAELQVLMVLRVHQVVQEQVVLMELQVQAVHQELQVHQEQAV